MSSGLMQLIAYGAQDIYLTGNPQITFFKVVYRRHTNFSIETIEKPFSGNIKLGNKIIAEITRGADLASRVFLKIIINQIDPNGSNFAWIRRLGHAIICKAELKLGGSAIDRQYGTWIDIWYELARQGDHEIGYAKMIGDIDILTNYDTNIKPQYVLYIPLQFWFNRYIGLAIPLIALQYNKVYIDLQLEDAEKLAVYDCNFDVSKISILDASILVDYVYLDTEERRRFAQVGHEYLIEQIQWNGEELVQDPVRKYRLDFNHPTKELFWAMKNGNYISGKDFLFYSNKDEWPIDEAACSIVNQSISIGFDPSDVNDGNWTEVPPNTIQTVGTFNVNNESDSSVYVNPESVKDGSYGITSQINVDITIKEDLTILCENVETTLTVRDLSIPVELLNDTRYNACDPKVYQFNNYGVLIDGTVNPVQWALIQFNGQDRLDRREGTYYNNVQPEQHHENTPRDGINVYSFAIFPEEHQPSGTANLSRIDQNDLTVWFADPTKTPTNPDLNLFNNENRFFVYAMNYNILRFMSGMAGLAYAGLQ